MNLKSKIALVTGANTGVGAAIAKKLENEGATVVRTSRTLDSNHEKLTLKADLTITDDINGLASFITEKFKHVDILVNCAAIWHTEDRALAGMDYQTFSESAITSTMRVGIEAPMLLVNKLLSIMPVGGKIVNITGTFENGAKGWLPYYVSKQALEIFTKGLSEELKDKDIQVNAISPSDTLTDAYKKFFPEEAKPENCVTPEQVAEEVLKFCDPDSKTTGEFKIVKK